MPTKTANDIRPNCCPIWSLMFRFFSIWSLMFRFFSSIKWIFFYNFCGTFGLALQHFLSDIHKKCPIGPENFDTTAYSEIYWFHKWAVVPALLLYVLIISRGDNLRKANSSLKLPLHVRRTRNESIYFICCFTKELCVFILYPQTFARW